MTKLKLAVDLDNTILNYKDSFSLAAKEMSLPSHLKNKAEFKKYLQSVPDWPKSWIRFQGLVYGKFIDHAQVQPAFYKIIQQHDVSILSHKTETSYCGNYKLQLLAKNFLDKNQISGNIRHVQFFNTLDDKMDAVNTGDYDLFIDDLSLAIQLCKIPSIHFSSKNISSKLNTTNWQTLRTILELDEFNGISERLGQETFKISNTLVLKKFDRFPSRSVNHQYFASIFSDNIELVVPPILKEKDHVFIHPLYKTSNINFLNKEHISSIEYFLTKLKNVTTTLRASHYASKEYDFFSNIENRFIALENIIQDQFSILISLFSILKERSNTELTNDLYVCPCFPDFFKENFSIHDNKLFISDFESVGLDSPARSLLNCIHHFGHTLTIEETTQIVNLFKNVYGVNIFKKAETLSDFIAYEWLLIGVNRFAQTNDSELLNDIRQKALWMEEAHQAGKSWTWQKDKLYLIHANTEE